MLPFLTTWQFAAAGVLGATIPVLIHFLMRRRHRHLDWGPIELLLKAAQESRRRTRLRDLMLLCLRCLAVFFFGLCLAQPYMAASRQTTAAQPVALTVLVDNSLSMRYQSFAGTRLDAAIRGARGVVERLPAGSQFRIVPLCGSSASSTTHDTPILEEAIAAIERIQIVDRPLSIAQIIKEVRDADDNVSNLDHRIVVFTDLQEISWNGTEDLFSNSTLPKIEVVDVSEPEWENTWVSQIHIQDGMAFAESEAAILVRLANRAQTDRDIRVDIGVDGADSTSRAISLLASETSREISVPVFFRGSDDLEAINWTAVSVSISADRLPVDDQRHELVPVIPSRSIVFVDEYGDREDRPQRQLGETWPLRKLLAATQSVRHGTLTGQHVRPEQLTEKTLSNARVVVIAGVADPGRLVPLLRDFVVQGGRLLLAAGGNFDPAAWSEAAWLDGRGILPAPLAARRVGMSSSQINDPRQLFSIAVESLDPHRFLTDGNAVTDDERQLFAEPIFFQAVRALVVDGTLSHPTTRNAAADWLRWTPPIISRTPSVDSPAEVIARFNDPDATPFLVSRRIGDGQVTLLASGLLPEWNTLSQSNAVLLYDHLLRAMLRSTVEPRNYAPVNQLVVPLPTASGRTAASLRRPRRTDSSSTVASGGRGESDLWSLEPLDVGFIDRDRRGATAYRLLDRGIYQIQLDRPSSPTTTTEEHITFSINGASRESDLTHLSPADQERVFASPALQLRTDANAAASGEALNSLWRLLAAAVLLLLLIELYLARGQSHQGANAHSEQHPVARRIVEM